MKLLHKHKGFVSLVVLGTTGAIAALFLFGLILGAALIGGSILGIGLGALRFTPLLRELDQEHIDMREV